MNEYLKLRYRSKVALLLSILLLCLLVSNIIGYKSDGKLEQSATSMYADRLMPSAYIFRISELLYREHAIMRSGSSPGNAAKMQAHQADIKGLIERYELTSFTSEERRHWSSFKTNLADLHRGKRYDASYQRHFDRTLHSLNALSAIQVTEGQHLQANVHTLVGHSSLRSHLETVLLIIIGGLAVQLIQGSKNVFERQWPHKASLN